MESNDKKIVADRILEIARLLNLDIKQLSNKIDVPYGTLQKYSSGKNSASTKLYLGLYSIGVNLNWFVSGKGDVFLKSHSYSQTNEQVTNDAAATYRGNIICDWIREYMISKSPDERIWLDVELAKKFPEYAQFKSNLNQQ